MKVLLVSYFYYPENTPRAFRANELVKSFTKKGHDITLLLPNKQVYENNTYPPNVKTIFVGKLIPNSSSKNKSQSSLVKKLREIGFLIKYYFFPLSFFGNFTNDAFNALVKLDQRFDLIFSNSFPFVTHLALAKAMKYNENLSKASVKIAEYSDPFTKQKHKKVLPLYAWLEKKVLSNFNYISIPTEKAKVSFLRYKTENKIIVLPQAYDLSSLSLPDYTPNSIPTFAYAGMFYQGMRDPSFLFEYLTKLKTDFKFIVYTRFPNDFFLLKYRKKLGDKIQVKVNIPREELIQELAQTDFLVNIDNDSTNQLPSKLIDYAITKRPIFSASSQSFSSKIFDDFLAGNYENKLQVDLSKHDITTITDKIEGLLND